MVGGSQHPCEDSETAGTTQGVFIPDPGFVPNFFQVLPKIALNSGKIIASQPF
jgi:hypothetical protein